MKTLKFDENYNGKLNQKIFTTIRKKSKSFPMGKVEVIFKTENADYQIVAPAEIIDRLDYESLRNVPAHTLFQDTGMGHLGDINQLFKSFGILPQDPVAVLTLKKLGDDHD